MRLNTTDRSAWTTHAGRRLYVSRVPDFHWSGQTLVDLQCRINAFLNAEYWNPDPRGRGWTRGRPIPYSMMDDVEARLEQLRQETLAKLLVVEAIAFLRRPGR